MIRLLCTGFGSVIFIFWYDFLSFLTGKFGMVSKYFLGVNLKKNTIIKQYTKTANIFELHNYPGL